MCVAPVFGKGCQTRRCPESLLYVQESEPYYREPNRPHAVSRQRKTRDGQSLPRDVSKLPFMLVHG